tara:strand:- start:1212 stop:1889 length:678 start_codon:yes stop_codon:yes gene_type:complete
MDDDLKVMMQDLEIALVKKYTSNRDLVLEWGSGGSTLAFSKSVKKYISIEHDICWYEQISSRIANDRAFDNIEYHYVPPNAPKSDIGLDGASKGLLSCAGDAVLHQNTSYWRTRGNFDWHCGINYISKPMELPYAPYDTIIVDGRCRVFCSYVSLFILKPEGYLVFHDFLSRRYYHGVLKYFEMVDHVCDLAILKPRKYNITDSEVKSLSDSIYEDYNTTIKNNK